jgi:hypothetical protein
MGIEALNNAARAAGFAMAASEEPYGEVEIVTIEAAAAVEVARAEPRQPATAAALREPARTVSRVGDLVRGMLGLFGRRAPASSA